MSDSDFQKLIDRDSAIHLRQLESDVWRREANIRADRRASRALASWQAVVIAFAILGSTAAGVSTATPMVSAEPRGMLSAGQNLAPSSLLFGADR